MRPASAGSIRADTRGEDERHWRTAAGDAPANHLGASRRPVDRRAIRIKPHHLLRRPVPIAPPSRTQPRTFIHHGRRRQVGHPLDRERRRDFRRVRSSSSGPAARPGPRCATADHTSRSKQYSQYFDPCQEAASRSLRCLHRNGGDRDMCSDYFQYAPPAGARALSPRFWPPRTDQLTPPSANTGFARAYRDCKKQWVRC